MNTLRNSASLLSGSAKLAVVAGLALALASGATAQSAPAAPTPPAPPQKIEGDFTQPLNTTVGRKRASSPNSSSNYTLIKQEGDNTLKLTVKNGEVQAELNGKPVPDDRIKREGDEIRILDENGKDVGAPMIIGENPFGGRNNELAVRAFRGNQAFPSVAGTAAMEDPPVMLGVTMSDADERVLDALGIKAEDGAIQIDSVRDDLPAAKGGLKEKDLIVSINGQTPATQEKLRDILKTGKPGDELKLKVMRRGQAQDLTIKLEAFDPVKLGRPAVSGAWDPVRVAPGGSWLGAGNEKAMEAARAELEMALKALREKAANIDVEKLHAEASESIQKALKALQEQSGGLRRYYMTTPAPDAPGLAAPGMVFSLPGGESGHRVQELEARLERMEKTLDTILKKLEEKK